MQENPIADILPLQSDEIVHRNEEYNFNIHHCFPAKGDYHLLVTDGLRHFKQNVNKDNEQLECIELYMSLPAYWKLKDRPWPIKWLNLIAQIPQKNKTWFGAGDTIPAGNPPEALDERLKANTFIIAPPILHKEDFQAKGSAAPKFQLMAVMPIFQNELDYKMKNSHTMLFKKFENKGVSEQLDLFRTSVYKRRFFGMFG